MTRVRWYILILGPLPILAVSWTLSESFRADDASKPAGNHVFEFPRLTRTATAAERKSRANESRSTDRLDRLCRDSASQLKKKAGDEAQIVVHPPFVITGDMSKDEIEGWYSRTIHPAAEAMANSYFRTAPTQPITILLYPEETSYNENAKKLFSDQGISVYGYYKPQSRTLVMNIGTGGGTLVHELTHALVDFDFPDVPDWFNEGLASLHEQCQFRDGNDGPWVEGLVNWRLTGLQKTIRAKRLRLLKEMIEANDFRGELEGTNYAQARYLCLYLQRHDLLVKFYKQFRQDQKQDLLGVKTLENVLSITSWPTFDTEFQKWVLTLKRG